MNKYFLIIANLLKHELISGSFYLFVGGIFGSMAAFLLNLFLARTLSYENYGIYVSLLSLFTLLTIPAGSLTATIVRFAAGYFARDEIDKASTFYRKLIIIWLLSGVALSIGTFMLAPLFTSFLHINNPLYILIIGVCIGISYFGVVNSAYLQSMTKFLYLSVITFFGNSTRLIVGALLVLAGFGVRGALIGVFSTPFVILVLGFIPLTFLFKRQEKKIQIDMREILSYSIPVVFGLISLSLFITTDTILVKHFFSPTLAGLYGGLSIVGKVIFYFTGMIPAVMFPLIVKKHTRGEEYKRIYLMAFLLIAIPSLLVTAVYFLFPDFVVKLFLGGHAYLGIVRYLGLYGIFITIFSLLSLTVNFFLSIKKTAISYLVFLFAVIQIVLIYFLHGSFYQVIYSSIFSVSLLLAILLLYFYYTHRS